MKQMQQSLTFKDRLLQDLEAHEPSPRQMRTR